MMYLNIKETRKTHRHIYILLPLLTLAKRRERGVRLKINKYLRLIFIKISTWR
jgi:hypothetical protein